MSTKHRWIPLENNPEVRVPPQNFQARSPIWIQHSGFKFCRFKSSFVPHHAHTTIKWAHAAGLGKSEAQFEDVYGLDSEVGFRSTSNAALPYATTAACYGIATCESYYLALSTLRHYHGQTNGGGKKDCCGRTAWHQSVYSLDQTNRESNNRTLKLPSLRYCDPV